MSETKTYRTWVVLIFAEGKDRTECRKEAEAKGYFVYYSEQFNPKYDYTGQEAKSYLDRIGADEFYFCL